MKFNTYFSSAYLKEKNALINLALSDRSDGKTFDTQYNILKDFKEKKRVSIYLRRFKTETSIIDRNSFFDDVKNKKQGEFDDLIFKAKGKYEILCSSDKGKTWSLICYIIPLTMSGKVKSTLVVKDIYDIYYDEFVPLDGVYLKNEINLMLEFWKSVDRDRMTTQLFIYGNKISPFNPLFDYFKIRLQILNNTIKTYQNGTLAVQIYSCQEHREKRKESRFNDLIKGTKYEEYDNGGILYALNLKIQNTDDCEYLFSFLTSVGEGSIWQNKKGRLIVSEKKRKDGFVIVDQIYNCGREEIQINYSKFPKFFKDNYRTGNISFESESAFNKFQDILTKIK